MFTKSPYQVMRTFNRLLLDDCMFENPSRDSYTAWLSRFYKEFNKAKRKYRDWDNNYINVDMEIDYHFCEIFTTRYFSYNEWNRFLNKLSRFNYKLRNYNQLLDDRDIKLFHYFMDSFTQKVADTYETELFELNHCDNCGTNMSDDCTISAYGGDQNIIGIIIQTNMFTMRTATIQIMMMMILTMIHILKGCIATIMMS